MRRAVRTGTGALLVVLIMFIGSLVLWIGTPLLWLWIGSQVEGETTSLSAAMATMFLGTLFTILVVATVLGKLSDIYRENCLARGQPDPGHFVLEGVLVISAGITVVGFGIWFFFFAGADPTPLGIQI